MIDFCFIVKLGCVKADCLYLGVAHGHKNLRGVNVVTW